jgi:hypothetical protein
MLFHLENQLFVLILILISIDQNQIAGFVIPFQELLRTLGLLDWSDI